MYDVLVIGAGPTGSSAAKELAKNGYNVLIVEKSKLPRNKSCSGILIKKSIELIELYFGESVPENIMCYSKVSKGMIFINDHSEKYVFEQNGLNIWRESLDYWLVQKALSVGAELRDYTIVVDYKENDGYVTVKLKNRALRRFWWRLFKPKKRQTRFYWVWLLYNEAGELLRCNQNIIPSP